MSNESENMSHQKINALDKMVDDMFVELVEEEDYDLTIDGELTSELKDELIKNYVQARGTWLIRRAVLLFAFEQEESQTQEKNT